MLIFLHRETRGICLRTLRICLCTGNLRNVPCRILLLSSRFFVVNIQEIFHQASVRLWLLRGNQSYCVYLCWCWWRQIYFYAKKYNTGKTKSTGKTLGILSFSEYLYPVPAFLSQKVLYTNCRILCGKVWFHFLSLRVHWSTRWRSSDHIWRRTNHFSGGKLEIWLAL